MIAEAESALVDPDHEGLYSSPLRPEPRPLRGILLAYHAIAYICAFYEEVISAGLGQAGICMAELPPMREKLAAAGEVLNANKQHLTSAGLRFLERTHDVAAA
jgi:HEXXH motif-containing protein